MQQQDTNNAGGGGDGAATAVSVYLRIRPPQRSEDDLDPITRIPTFSVERDAFSGKATTARAMPPLTASHSQTINRDTQDYSFSEVFDRDAAQAYVYSRTTQPLVDDLMQGRSALLFAYGLTNGGKTYSTIGDTRVPGREGILPRALNDIFERLQSLSLGPTRVILSFLEVYNENVYDLLASRDADDWSKAREALKLQDKLGRIEVRNLTQHTLTSAEHGLQLIESCVHIFDGPAGSTPILD